MNPVYSQFTGAGEACTGGQKKRQPCGAAFFMYYLPCGIRVSIEGGGTAEPPMPC